MNFEFLVTTEFLTNWIEVYNDNMEGKRRTKSRSMNEALCLFNFRMSSPSES